MTLTKLEEAFFENLDLFCRLKLGINAEVKCTDSGSAFIEDIYDILCNIMASDPNCFHKLIAYYKHVNASLPEGVEVSAEEALATKHACEKVFISNGFNFINKQ